MRKLSEHFAQMFCDGAGAKLAARAAAGSWIVAVPAAPAAAPADVGVPDDADVGGVLGGGGCGGGPIVPEVLGLLINPG